MRVQRIRLALALVIAVSFLVAAHAARARSSPCETLSAGKCKVALSTGIEMAYLEAGAGSRQTVILIHGFADNARTWAPAMASLHRLDSALHILAVDLRGHGDSSMPSASRCAAAPERCFGLRDFAADIIAFMNALGISRAVIVGHSLGSLVAAEVALSHPKRVTRVVLVATATSSRSISGNVHDLLTRQIEGVWARPGMHRGEVFPRDFFMQTPVEANRQSLDFIVNTWNPDPAMKPGVLRPLADEAAHTRMGTWIGAARTLMRFDLSRRLRELTVPALVIWGSQDVAFREIDQQQVRLALAAAARAHGTRSFWKQYGVHRLPSSGLQVSDIGHEAQWEAPDTLAADIDSFVRRSTPTLDLPHSDRAPHIDRILIEKGRAHVVKLRRWQSHAEERRR